LVEKHTPSALQSIALALRLAWNLGYIIAIPAVAFGFSGALLDRAWGTSPLFVLLGFALAALLSALGVAKRVKSILGTENREPRRVVGDREEVEHCLKDCNPNP